MTPYIVKFLNRRRDEFPEKLTAAVLDEGPGSPWPIKGQAVSRKFASGHEYRVSTDSAKPESLALVRIRPETKRELEYRRVYGMSGGSRYHSDADSPYSTFAHIPPNEARWLSDRLNEFATAHGY